MIYTNKAKYGFISNAVEKYILTSATLLLRGIVGIGSAPREVITHKR